MNQQIYLTDIKKGAMYQNRVLLKDRGFKYDPVKKTWYSDAPIDDATLKLLIDAGISITGKESPAPENDRAVDPVPGARMMVSGTGVSIIAAKEAENFNIGAYLHSRVKNGKPVDGWFVDSKCQPGTFFASIYPGAATVIQHVQTAGMDGKPIKPALWLFVCDKDGNVIARLKVMEK